MNNYEKMQEAARQHFLEYNWEQLGKKPGVKDNKTCLETCFCGEICQISRETGHIYFPARGCYANFSESLSIYDWLCDRKPDAVTADVFCSVNSLPGVLVSGSGLGLSGDALAPLVEKNTTAFSRRCTQMGGRQVEGADIAWEIPAFPDLPVRLHFYAGDEEFAPRLRLLWDANILQFIRYETIYYLAGCILARLKNF